MIQQGPLRPLFSFLGPKTPSPSIRVFYNESVLCIRWPKHWSFSFSISPSNEYSGLISFRMDWLDLLAVQGNLQSLHTTFKSINSFVLSFLYSPTILSMKFSRPEHWSGSLSLIQEILPNPGSKSRSPALQADSLPAESQGKPKNTAVDSLSLLQRIFLTQESKWGLLNCRLILYQLSYQGSPTRTYFIA